jgi:Rrp15p
MPDAVPAPAPLSSGAGKALGSVLSRLLDDKKDGGLGLNKRPRPDLGLILAADEDVAQAAHDEVVERTKDRENKRAKLRFEACGRVIPDAATGAAREKALRETATRGIVALFNAVSKSQKAASAADSAVKTAADDAAARRAKKNKEPVSREGFMDMLRAGVNKPIPGGENAEKATGGEDEPTGASWMKDNYMTKGARKMKDWNKEDEGSEGDDVAGGVGDLSDDDGDSSDSQGDFGDVPRVSRHHVAESSAEGGDSEGDDAAMDDDSGGDQLSS